MLNNSQDAGPEGRRAGAFFAWFRRQRWFLLFVVAPFLLGAFYYTAIASDRYVSEARFVIKSPGQRPAQLSTLANLLQTTGISAGQEQANEVLEYLRSRDALAYLQKSMDFRERYSTKRADFLTGFPDPLEADTIEDLYKYYGDVVSARVEPETGIVSLQAWAFTPNDARKVNELLLSRSEALVNQLNERAKNRSVTEAEERVKVAEARVRNARTELRMFRNAESLLDPNQQALGVLEVTNRLIAEQAIVRAELEQTERATPDNPAIPAMRARIAALGNQIAAQSGRAVGTQGGIASKLGQYENLVAEQEFAQEMLTVANASLEQARSEILKQQFYLERIVEPNTPDSALLPKRWQHILTLAAALLCLYMIGWMLITGIVEHSPEN